MTPQEKKFAEKQRREQLDAMREEVQERELRARFSKANWELMYYSIEAEALQPAYKEYVDRELKKQEEARQAKDIQVKALMEQLNNIQGDSNQSENTSEEVLEAIAHNGTFEGNTKPEEEVG